MNVANRVASKSLHRVSPPYVLPRGVLRAFTLINKIHWIWRLYTIGERVKGNSLCETLTKKSVSLFFRDSAVFKDVSQFILGVKRIVDCINGSIAVNEAIQKLHTELRGEYPLYQQKSWDLHAEWISPSHLRMCKTFLEQTARYVMRVVIRFFDLLKALFQLSMLTLDAIDSFYLSPSTQQEAGEEMAPNALKLMNGMASSSDLLLEKVKVNKEWVSYILAEGRAGFTAEQMITILEKISSGAKKTSEVAEIVGPSILNFVADSACRVLCSLVGSFLGGDGLSLLPDGMIRTVSPPASPTKVKNRGQRYVSVREITKLKKEFRSTLGYSDIGRKPKESAPPKISTKKLVLLRNVLEPISRDH